jgi:hypothetical protein
VYRLRSSAAYRGAFHILSRHVWPNVFGLAMLFVVFVMLPIRVGSLLAGANDRLGPSTCGGAPMRANGDTDAFAVWPRLTCNATGVTASAGVTYRIEVALPPACGDGETQSGWDTRLTGEWADRTVRVERPDGFSTASRLASGARGLVFLTALPLRRQLGAQWFAPVVSIGGLGGERHAVGASTTFTAGRSGPITLYVNDVVAPCPSWDCFYTNNAGGPARVRITQPTGAAASTSLPLVPYSCELQRELADRYRKVFPSRQ